MRFNRILSPVVLVFLVACGVTPFEKSSSSGAGNDSGVIIVPVRGVGVDSGQAIENGQQLALQEVFGVFQVADRVVDNNSLTDKSFSYSKGIVEGYEIVSAYRSPKDGLYHVEMNVKVSAAKVRHSAELVAEAGTQSFPGKQLASDLEQRRSAIRIQSEGLEKRAQQAERLAVYIGSQFPVGTVKAGTIQFANDRNYSSSNPRGTSATLDFEIELNKEYFSGLCAALKAYRDATEYRQCYGSLACARDNWKYFLKVQTFNWGTCMPGRYAIPVELASQLQQIVKRSVICINFLGADGGLVHRMPVEAAFPAEHVKDPGKPGQIMPLLDMIGSRGAPYFLDERNELVLTTRSYTQRAILDNEKLNGRLLPLVKSI